MRNRFLLVMGLALGALLLLGSGVKADNYTTNFSLPSDAAVTIAHTNASSPAGAAVTGQNTWAVPFSVTDTSNSVTFQGFCIDLYHTVTNGQTTTNNPSFATVAGSICYGATTTGTTGNQNFPNYSGYATDLGSKLNYLGAVYNQLQASSYANDTYLLGAVQLAVWTLLDVKFVASNEKGGMASDLTAIMKLVGATGVGGTANSTFYTDNGTSAGQAVTINGFNPYSTSANYSALGGVVLLVHTTLSDGGSIQNIIHWGGIGTTSIGVPEPSALAIAGLGGLGFLAYGCKRRKHA